MFQYPPFNIVLYSSEIPSSQFHCNNNSIFLKKTQNSGKGYFRYLCHTVCKTMGALVRYAVLLILVAQGGVANANNSAERQAVYNVNLPRQSVAQSLSDLSEQTDQMLLFSYEEVEPFMANPVVGRYSVQQAVEIMLQGTGFSGSLTSRGVLMISSRKSLAPDDQTEGIEHMNSKKAMLASVVSFFVGPGAPGVLAQASENSIEDNLDFSIEEVVVTATKRSTSLQDTAMSVSAISSERLEAFKIRSFDQILATVPGASVVEAGPGASRVQFRGISTNSFQGGNSATATYIDEFPMSARGATVRGGGVDVKLIDMAQVEALKGPQGTLYGQSALSGVIRYITNKPNSEGIEGGIDYSYESVEGGDTGYHATGFLNIPLNERLAARIVLYDFDSAGFIDNLGTGTRDVNNEEVTGGRIALHWDVSDRIDVNLLYLNQEATLGGGLGGGGYYAFSTYTQSDSTSVVLTPPSLSDPAIVSNTDPYTDSSIDALNLSLNVSFDQFDLAVLGSSKTQEQDIRRDVSYFFSLYDGQSVTGDADRSNVDQTSFEVRLVSNSESKFDWIVGAWYENVDNDSDRVLVLETPRTDLPFTDGTVWMDRDVTEELEEISAYGEIGYAFTDKLKTTVGYRRTDLTIDQSVSRANGVLDSGLDAALGVDEQTKEDINTYKFNLEYRIAENILSYAQMSSGYRAGGYNRGGFGTAGSPYGTDDLWNYELGFRTSWLEDRIIANFVGYYIDWDDMQLRSWDNDAAQVTIQNVGKATVRGLESEFQFQISTNLSVALNYAYIDAELAEDFFDSNPSVNMITAEKGDRLPGSSKHNVSIFLDWRSSITDEMDLLANLSYRYNSDRVSNLGNFSDNSLGGFGKIPSAYVADLVIGIEHFDGISVSLFANNLTDERNTQYEALLGPLELLALNRPRTTGVRLAYRF